MTSVFQNVVVGARKCPRSWAGLPNTPPESLSMDSVGVQGFLHSLESGHCECLPDMGLPASILYDNPLHDPEGIP